MVDGVENRWYTGLNLHPDNQLQEISELDSFDTDYFTLAPYFGHEWHLSSTLGEGSLLAESGYSYVGGSEANMGSARHHGELRIGWNQRVPLPLDRTRLFLSPKLGMGLGGDKLNFGDGTFPEWAFGFSTQAEVTAGAEYCFTPHICLAAGGGYFYERNLIGADYDNHGPSFGVAVNWDMEPEVRIETVVETKTITVKEIVEKIVYLKDEKPEELTLEKIAMSLVSDGESFGIPYFFKTESKQLGLREGEEPNLNILAFALQEHPEIKLFLEGHTDNTGPENKNNWLSYQRAKAVQNYLIKAGVDRARVAVDGRDLSLYIATDGKKTVVYYTNEESLEATLKLDEAQKHLPPNYEKQHLPIIDEKKAGPGIWIRNAAGQSVLGSSKPLLKITSPKIRKTMEKRVEFKKIK
ncbi:MAG: OmpA family protein [Deltaproteobacteria bacterium]|nr:OmpA family protein [Deltaproteobacteria bacterium]